MASIKKSSFFFEAMANNLLHSHGVDIPSYVHEYSIQEQQSKW